MLTCFLRQAFIWAWQVLFGEFPGGRTVNYERFLFYGGHNICYNNVSLSERIQVPKLIFHFLLTRINEQYLYTLEKTWQNLLCRRAKKTCHIKSFHIENVPLRDKNISGMFSKFTQQKWDIYFYWCPPKCVLELI